MKTKNFRIMDTGATASIRIYPDGTATFRRKRYTSYNAARQALTRFAGWCIEIKQINVL